MKCIDRKMDNTIVDNPGEDSQREYEMAVEMAQYCEIHEPTYNPEDGSM